MQRLYIKGVVRLASSVRRELSAPVTAARRDALRRSVSDAVRAVAQIISSNGLTASALPPPTRHAYQYLAGLDLDQIAVAGENAAPRAPVVSEVRMNGLRSLIDALCDKLADFKDHDDLQRLHRVIESHLRSVDTEMARIRIEAHHLTEESRRARAWLAYMSGADRLAQYLQAVRRARPLLEAAAQGTRFRLPLWVHFRPTSSLYSARPAYEGTRLTLQTAMMAWSPQDYTALGGLIFRRNGDRKRIDEALRCEGYRAVRAELDRLEAQAERAAGAFHDLNASFDRVNQEYFGGAMARPRLTWNDQATGCKFGHYDALHDTLMLSMTLDARDVPQFVVDFVTYHELLHKQLGTQWRNGRRHVHTPDFRRLERQFRRYHEAEAYLNRLSAAYLRGAAAPAWVESRRGAVG